MFSSCKFFHCLVVQEWDFQLNLEQKTEDHVVSMKQLRDLSKIHRLKHDGEIGVTY